MSNASNIQQIEVSIEEIKKVIDRKAMAEKLISNREFRKLITEGYLKDEAVRLVGLSADPNLADHKETIFLEIQAISVFQQYMKHIIQMGTMAENELADHEELLLEARQEEMI